MAGIAISMMSMAAMLAMLALVTLMFSRRWICLVAALRGPSQMLATPMCPPAETNVVMLRPRLRTSISRPQPALRMAA